MMLEKRQEYTPMTLASGISNIVCQEIIIDHIYFIEISKEHHRQTGGVASIEATHALYFFRI